LLKLALQQDLAVFVFVGAFDVVDVAVVDVAGDDAVVADAFGVAAVNDVVAVDAEPWKQHKQRFAAALVCHWLSFVACVEELCSFGVDAAAAAAVADAGGVGAAN